MNAREGADGRRWPLPLLISVVVNLLFAAAMVRLVTGPASSAAEIAVELELPVVRERPPSTPSIAPLAETPTPRPIPAVPRIVSVPTPTQPRIVPGSPPRQQPEITASSGSSAPGPAGAFTGPANGTGTGIEGGAGLGEAVTGGSGGGGAGPSAGGPSSGSSSGPAGTGPGAVRAEPPPTPAPPAPAPKGETRGIRILNQTRPSYPASAREEEVEGTATILVHIDDKGTPVRITLEKSSGDSRLDKAAEQAVRQWTYEPALKDGAPVPSSLRVRVQFRLD